MRVIRIYVLRLCLIYVIRVMCKNELYASYVSCVSYVLNMVCTLYVLFVFNVLHALHAPHVLHVSHVFISALLAGAGKERSRNYVIGEAYICMSRTVSSRGFDA